LLTLIEEDWDHAADEIQTIFDGIKDEIHRDADDLAAFLAVEADTPDYSSLLTLIFQTLTSSVYNWLMSWFKNDPLGTYRQIITIHGGGAIWSANNQPVLTMVYQFDGVDSHYEVAANLTLVAA
jgi:hypothetical protein